MVPEKPRVTSGSQALLVCVVSGPSAWGLLGLYLLVFKNHTVPGISQGLSHARSVLYQLS